MARFKVGDALKVSGALYVNNNRNKKPTTQWVVEEVGRECYKLRCTEYGNAVSPFITFVDDACELALIKVKATRLAKKMYPNAEEQDGMLLVEA